VVTRIGTLATLARILFMGVVLSTSLRAFAQEENHDTAQRPCSKQISLFGPCFSIRGRLALYNGNPTARIWKVGTNRLLGVSESRCQRPECARMPKELEDSLSWENVIFGDFLVCPFTESKPGHMQFVCIESVKNPVVKERQ
jgi:hypothetical protein